MKQKDANVMRLVYYSLLLPENSYNKVRINQLIGSVQSLRKFNSSIRVQVHLIGELPESALAKLKSFNVHIINFQPYADLIEQHLPGCGLWLSRYPVMHKFLTMNALQQFNPAQALYLDSDTYILGDIERLFDNYSDAHIYAREEPGSRNSPIGYHPDYLDEDKLFALEAELNCSKVEPFNTGVLLMNKNIWAQLLCLAREYLMHIARFSIWMEGKEQSRNASPDVVYLTRNKSNLCDVIEKLPPLPFPSSNFWIKEQVALWLSVGSIKNISTGTFELDHVLQGGEELRAPGQLLMPIVSHYYTKNTTLFIETIQSTRFHTLYRES
jgi:hypothetical protein